VEEKRGVHDKTMSVFYYTFYGCDTRCARSRGCRHSMKRDVELKIPTQTTPIDGGQDPMAHPSKPLPQQTATQARRSGATFVHIVIALSLEHMPPHGLCFPI